MTADEKREKQGLIDRQKRLGSLTAEERAAFVADMRKYRHLFDELPAGDVD